VRAYEHVAGHTEIERTSTVGLAKAPLTGYPVTKLLIRQDIEFYLEGRPHYYNLSAIARPVWTALWLGLDYGFRGREF